METLIINKRSALSRSKRIIWDSITALLWLLFIYMWKPVLIIFYKIITSEVPPDEVGDWIFDNISSITFWHAVFMLTATPIVLFILSSLSRNKKSSTHLIYDSSDYANYFHLDDTQLEESINSQFVTVYFDNNGHIIRLDNQILKNEL